MATPHAALASGMEERTTKFMHADSPYYSYYNMMIMITMFHYYSYQPKPYGATSKWKFGSYAYAAPSDWHCMGLFCRRIYLLTMSIRNLFENHMYTCKCTEVLADLCLGRTPHFLQAELTAGRGTILVRLVLFGPCLAEQLHHLQVPVVRRLHQGCGTFLVGLVLVGPGLAEQLHHLQVSVVRRLHQGCGTFLVGLVLVGPGLAEQLHHLRVTDSRHIDQGRVSVLVRLVLVGPGLA